MFKEQAELLFNQQTMAIDMNFKRIRKTRTTSLNEFLIAGWDEEAQRRMYNISHRC